MRKRGTAAWLLAATVATVGCGTPPGPAPPLRERVSTAPLTSEIGRAQEALRRARGAEGLPPAAESALAAAEQALGRLESVIVPLLHAREGAFDAYRLLASGDGAGCRRELDAVEEELLRLAESGGPSVAREVEEPLARLARARLAMGEEPPAAAERIRALAVELDELYAKAQLFLGE